MNYFQFAKVKQTYEVTHLQDRGVTGHYKHYRRITKLFLLVVLINKFNKFLVLSKIGTMSTLIEEQIRNSTEMLKFQEDCL
jgi:O-acetylhomoserine/O-acetylserine sulfhydrylase-like pyridoxal-dependent enzyme